jgi:hypothetical protein
MRRISFLFFCLLYSISYAQISLKGTILSKSDRKPIPYAIVSTKNASIGINANETGYFALTSTETLEENDLVVISAIGFVTLRLPYGVAKNLSDFLLEEKPVALEEVTVSRSGKPYKVWKGAEKGKSNESFGGVTTSLKELGLRFPNFENLSGYIQKIGFYIMGSGKPQTPFRIRVYSIKNNAPDRDLLTQSITVKPKRGAKWLVVDVGQYSIPFESEGVVIAMEWLNTMDKAYAYEILYPKPDGSKEKRIEYGQYLGLTNEFRVPMGWYRLNSGDWKLSRLNPMIKAEIEVYHKGEAETPLFKKIKE